MSTYKLFIAAIRDSDAENRAYGVSDQAEILVMGGIGQVAHTKSEFVKAGLDYLERLPELVVAALEEIQEKESAGDKINNDLVDAVKEYLVFLSDFDREEFVELLESHWVDQYGDE